MGRNRKGNIFCLQCGIKIPFNPVRRQYAKKFCSQKCSYEFHRMENNPSWKGGRSNNGSGYMWLSIGNGKQVLEHRYLMEKFVGRKLNKDEFVHHKDGNKKNNNISNLQLMTPAEHTSHHHLGKTNLNKRLFEIFETLPKASVLGKIISLLPEYRTYITILCPVCNKFHWTRKDYLKIKNDPTCSSRCGHIREGHNVNR